MNISDLIGPALIVSGLFLSLIGGFAIYQRRKRVHSTPYLLLTFLSGIFYVATLVLALILDWLTLLDFNYSNMIALLFLNFTYFAVLRHFEALSNPKPQVWSNSLFSGILGADLMLLFLLLLGQSPFNKVMYYYIALSYILGIISFGYGVVIVYRTYQLVKERAIGIIMSAVITLLASNAVYTAGTVLLIVTLIDSTTYAAVSMLGGILLLGGLLIFLATYILKGNYLDIAPVPIHVILFYNSQGLLVYSRNVYYPGELPLEFTKPLITGDFAAISAVFHRALGKKA
ncbi:MAG: hypothetical protein ACFFD4_15270 [Candidatus Odinarchaeota archaeon]